MIVPNKRHVQRNRRCCHTKGFGTNRTATADRYTVRARRTVMGIYFQSIEYFVRRSKTCDRTPATAAAH
jgi:hypothetical protein